MDNPLLLDDIVELICPGEDSLEQTTTAKGSQGVQYAIGQDRQQWLHACHCCRSNAAWFGLI